MNGVLKTKHIDETPCHVVAISEGYLPLFFNPDYMYEINDGYKMGLFAANILLGKIRQELKDEEEAKIYYI